MRYISKSPLIFALSYHLPFLAGEVHAANPFAWYRRKRPVKLDCELAALPSPFYKLAAATGGDAIDAGFDHEAQAGLVTFLRTRLQDRPTISAAVGGDTIAFDKLSLKDITDILGAIDSEFRRAMAGTFGDVLLKQVQGRVNSALIVAFYQANVDDLTAEDICTLGRAASPDMSVQTYLMAEFLTRRSREGRLDANAIASLAQADVSPLHNGKLLLGAAKKFAKSAADYAALVSAADRAKLQLDIVKEIPDELFATFTAADLVLVIDALGNFGVDDTKTYLLRRFVTLPSFREADVEILGGSAYHLSRKQILEMKNQP